MSLAKISPAEAKALADRGAVLVDIREPAERAREHIENSVSLPLSQLSHTQVPKGAETVVFYCRSGMRTASNAAALASKSGCRAYVLDGGIDAWRRAGLPVNSAAPGTHAPMEMFRQVQITAGLLVLAGVLLATYVAPNWIWLAAAIGAGLVFSGASGTCPMANLLALMPWNRA